MTGKLIGIARKSAHRAPMETVHSIMIWPESGLEGDHSGSRHPNRQVTVLAREDWLTAVALTGAPDLPWTARRANLLIEGIVLPRSKGSVLRIGAAILDITGQTVPCFRMDEAQTGLRKSLHSEWRGGVTCTVVEGGRVQLGDDVELLLALPERKVFLPG